MTSSKSGKVQLYWNSGRGYREPESSVQAVASGDEPKTYLLPLPMGAYPELRFDPIDNDGRVELWDLAIVDAQGRVWREIPWADIEALNQIKSISAAEGRLSVEVTPGGDDPQLRVKFADPLVVRLPPEPAAKVLAALARISLTTFVLLLGVLAAPAIIRPPAKRRRRRRGSHGASAGARPLLDRRGGHRRQLVSGPVPRRQLRLPGNGRV